jgi:phosphoribosyl-ATP pyrophosphohydrolase
MNTLVSLPACSARPASCCTPAAFANELERLYSALNGVTCAENPRTARLMSAGLRKISQKVVEEAAEVALEAVRERTDTTVGESADLLYHLVVLWHALEIRPADVWAEMRQRAQTNGIAEKRPKPCGRITADRSFNHGARHETQERALVSGSPIIHAPAGVGCAPISATRKDPPCDC